MLKWLLRLLKLMAGATLLLLVAVLVFIGRSLPFRSLSLRPPKRPGIHRRRAQMLLSQPILSEPGHTRVLLLCHVTELHTVLPALERNAVRLEHIYDY